ncbi:MAG: ABC transporter permease [Candidatus Dormibacteria bacterium]
MTRLVSLVPSGGRRAIPRSLLLVAVAVAMVLLLPLAFLVLEAHETGWGEISGLVFRPLTGELLWNVVRLMVVVTALAAAVGTGAAWLVERSDLPGRRLWAVLLILPLAVPDFVVAFSWVSVAPQVSGFWGAVLVMASGLYPLVYLPVGASLRGADGSQEDVARTLGQGPLATFWRITLRQARPTLLAGCLLVALALLAEYGAFEVMGYQTFTTEIFTEFQAAINAPAASALSLVLVAFGLLILAAEGSVRDQGRLAGRTSGAPVRRPPQALGRWRWPALGGLGLVLALALGMPVGVIVYWLFRGGSSSLPQTASVADALWHTVAYSGSAAVIAALLALPVALLAVRFPLRPIRVLERSTYIVQGVPGLVIALALVFFSLRYLTFVYQSPELLVAAYAILFFPLAYVAVRASALGAPLQLEEVARSLGSSALRARLQVTLPLIAPGLLAAFCLVFLSAVTELTATLVLIPTGQETLATQFWAYTGNVSYGAAAPYAGAMVAISLGPGLLLSYWYNRRPRRRGTGL